MQKKNICSLKIIHILTGTDLDRLLLGGVQFILFIFIYTKFI